MGRVAALLAAVLALTGGLVACGEDGAEPGAPEGATLVLDFQPNAVHAPLYASIARGEMADAGIDLDVREPSGTADGAKLLESGRADFAILDINDFGIAREQGVDLVAVAAIVQRPLASVIAAGPEAPESPSGLEGETVGVTGVPSDDAVLDTVLARAGPGARLGRAQDDRLHRGPGAGRRQDRGRDGLLERRGRAAAPAGRPGAGVPRGRVRRAPISGAGGRHRGRRRRPRRPRPHLPAPPRPRALLRLARQRSPGSARRDGRQGPGAWTRHRRRASSPS